MLVTCFVPSSVAAAVVVRAVIAAVLLVPAISMSAGGLGTATKGFRAGKYYNRTATIASLKVTELNHASKADNIEGLLALARTERRGSFDEIADLQAWEAYNRIPQGDRLINGGYYRARLWTMRVDNGELRIDLQRIRSKSDKVDEAIDDPGTRVLVPPGVIRIAAPRDRFEATIVAAYKEALGNLNAAR